VEYDPAVVSFDKLVSVLWGKIDPTQREGQGNDRGSQYRTGIYYHDEEQKAIALASREAEEKCAVLPKTIRAAVPLQPLFCPAHAPAIHRRIGRTIHTEVFPATQWYQGEGYHQQYLVRVPLPLAALSASRFSFFPLLARLCGADIAPARVRLCRPRAPPAGASSPPPRTARIPSAATGKLYAFQFASRSF
jgi:peptide methionine sulfoxide reductase MsrA